MNHDIEIAVEPPHDAFAEAAEAPHGPSNDLGDGRVHGAEDKRARAAQGLEGLSDDARVERLEIDDDIGELRHTE
jgi:hypothetical protein